MANHAYSPTRVANPSAPCGIQKRPETPICPKFVPTIVFRGSGQGGPNLSKTCRKIENLSGNCRFSIFRQIFSTFRQIFHKFGSP